MFDDFIDLLCTHLQQKRYLVERDPVKMGMSGLLYACSPQKSGAGPITYTTHFLFVDWENDLFERFDVLKEVRENFSDLINKEYHIPRAWRMKIPNMAVVALSTKKFAPNVVKYVENKYYVPFVGGETGQIILIDFENHVMIHHIESTNTQTGSIPMVDAVNELKQTVNAYFLLNKSRDTFHVDSNLSSPPKSVKTD